MRLGAEHESAATPEAAGAQSMMQSQIVQSMLTTSL